MQNKGSIAYNTNGAGYKPAPIITPAASQYKKTNGLQDR